jgi:small GTP-binding protein
MAEQKSAKLSPESNHPLIEKKILDQLLLIDKIREKISQKVIVVCNKCDDEEVEIDVEAEVHQLGFKKHIKISAQHGNNMHQVWEVLNETIPPEKITEYEELIQFRKYKIKKFKKQFEVLVEDYLKEFKEKNTEENMGGIKEEINWHETDVNYQKMKKKGKHLDKEYYMELFQKMNQGKEFDSDIDDDEIPLENILKLPKLIEEKGISYDNPQYNNKIEVAIIGRPNVGKSTLTNKWLGRTLSLVDENSHTTRDTSSGELKVQNRKIELIDTAGLDKSLKHSKSELDRMSFNKTKKKVKFAQIHVILVDSLWAFREQDYGLIRQSLDEGRGVIVFINKWDLVDPSWYVKAKRFIYRDIDKNVDVKGLPIVFGSALKK